MNFRILDYDAVESGDFEKSVRAYRKHLRRFEKGWFDRNLWKFFYWDFFHDGVVESIQAIGAPSTVTIKLNSLNIRRIKPDGSSEDINIGFTCAFRGVTAFSVQYDPRESPWDPTGPTYFLHSEINTSPILKKSQPEEDAQPRYSLLMKLLAGKTTIWAELVFLRVDIEADEPAAFALMEASPKFKVPTWSEKKGRKKRL